MNQPELTVCEVKTDELIPYANNAKLHSDLQVETIVNSIEDYGFNDPIAVWHNDDGEMEIVEGHGRVLAAKRIGLDKVPVIYLDHLSDKQRREYTHVHNQTTLNSGFDFTILDNEFSELADFDPERFGFDTFDFNPDSLFNEEEAIGGGSVTSEPKAVTCPECGAEFVPHE